MKILRSVLLLFALLVLISSTQSCGNADCVLTGFVNCDDGGGADKSKINGTVASVTNGSVSGIKVRAERNGEKVASDTTNSDGDFTLKVRDGAITLEFETSTFTVARMFTITEDSEVLLIVSLGPNQILVDNWEVLQDPIRCDNNQNFIITNDVNLVDFTINGNGKDCIRAKGDCLIDIEAQNIILNDCNEGLIAEGSASVTLEALAFPTLIPTLTINAESNGIHTKGDSTVTLIGGNISVTSTGADGIRAEDSSDVEIQPSGLCTIEGSDDAIQKDGTATVDSDGCTLVIGN